MEWYKFKQLTVFGKKKMLCLIYIPKSYRECRDRRMFYIYLANAIHKHLPDSNMIKYHIVYIKYPSPSLKMIFMQVVHEIDNKMKTENHSSIRKMILLLKNPFNYLKRNRLLNDNDIVILKEKMAAYHQMEGSKYISVRWQ